ncbi:hypothetical protein Sm713_22560 [Streptomyces sp. TS71-3]|nr:hypothetical protein Sm713_22560 [Streptomyces sp. TS71-3]
MQRYEDGGVARPGLPVEELPSLHGREAVVHFRHVLVTLLGPSPDMRLSFTLICILPHGREGAGAPRRGGGAAPGPGRRAGAGARYRVGSP